MSGPETHLEKNTPPDMTDQLILRLMKKTDDQLLTELNQIFGFVNHRSCLKESYLLDFYFCGFLWMKRMKFCVKQTTFFMSLLRVMMSNLQGKQMKLLENLMEFIEALSRQCLSSEKETLDKDTEEVCALISFLEKSLFQKCKIYQLLFRAQRDELLVGAEREVEVFGCSASPLDEGLPAPSSHLKLL